MKKRGILKLCIALCFAFALVFAPVNRLEAKAEEVTVSGTVMSGTTSELLLLSTKEGKMEIKIDSGTDTSGCKVLLPDKKINVTVSHGSDGYLPGFYRLASPIRWQLMTSQRKLRFSASRW